MTGWDHPDTVRYYEAFNRRHNRYRTANRALVRHAQLRPGLRVLDFAAGTGGTTAVALDVLGADGRVDCVEPAQAMRAAGVQKFDGRVRWFADLASAATAYDRILCGAAIWQVPEIAACIEALALGAADGAGGGGGGMVPRPNSDGEAAGSEGSAIGAAAAMCCALVRSAISALAMLANVAASGGAGLGGTVARFG